MGVREPSSSCTHDGLDDDWCDPSGVKSASEKAAETSAAAEASAASSGASAGAAGVGGVARDGGVAGDGSPEDGEAGFGASVGAGAASASAFSGDRFGSEPSGTMASAETNLCVYQANRSTLAVDVNQIVYKAVMEKSTEVAPMPGMSRGDDPELNLSWLICGADRLTGKWPANHICEFDAPPWVKGQASELSKTLARVPSPSWEHSLVLRIFIEFCDLVAAQKGMLPLGVILGYMAITGTPAEHHVYVDSLNQEIAYILPVKNSDGTPKMNDIVKTGWQLHAKGDV